MFLRLWQQRCVWASRPNRWFCWPDEECEETESTRRPHSGFEEDLVEALDRLCERCSTRVRLLLHSVVTTAISDRLRGQCPPTCHDGSDLKTRMRVSRSDSRTLGFDLQRFSSPDKIKSFLGDEACTSC